MSIFEDCSPKELDLLEFLAEALAKNPEQLKEQLEKSGLQNRCKVIAFCKMRVPKLGEDIEKLLDVEDEGIKSNIRN